MSIEGVREAVNAHAAALFFVDLDGTLLDESGALPARNRDAIVAAGRTGVTTVVVTGRRLSGFEAVRAELDGLPYRLATSNGAVVLEPCNRRPLAVHSIPWRHAFGLAADARFRHATVLCITAPATAPAATDGDAGGDCWLRAPSSRGWHGSATPYRPETWKPASEAVATARPLVHLALRIDTRTEADRIASAIGSELDRALSVHVVRSPWGRGALVEVVPSGGKGLAVRTLAAELGVAPDALGAIGDELNDDDLLSAATHRFAVGGSVLAGHRADATVVAPARDGAVADALERFQERLSRGAMSRPPPTMAVAAASASDGSRPSRATAGRAHTGRSVSG